MEGKGEEERRNKMPHTLLIAQARRTDKEKYEKGRENMDSGRWTAHQA